MRRAPLALLRILHLLVEQRCGSSYDSSKVADRHKKGRQPLRFSCVVCLNAIIVPRALDTCKTQNEQINSEL
eukprot:3389522-Amphidinium_carterae.1